MNARDKLKMAGLVEDLTMQFNSLRSRSPLIMDSLLETIDSMRLMQKNYTKDNLYFGYDYKKDLEKTALERERIFRTQQIREETEESDDDGLFREQEEEDAPEPEEAAPVKKSKKRAKVPRENEEPEQEQAEFPEELPLDFGMMKFAG